MTENYQYVDENLTQWPKNTSKHQKMQKKKQKTAKNDSKIYLKKAKPPQNRLHWELTFPCYTEAHLENQRGLLAALANGPAGFLGGLR